MKEKLKWLRQYGTITLRKEAGGKVSAKLIPYTKKIGFTITCNKAYTVAGVLKALEDSVKFKQKAIEILLN
jgi:hypothetical protein